MSNSISNPACESLSEGGKEHDIKQEVLTAASDLPPPESTEELDSLLPYPPTLTPKGLGGALFRAVRRIPPCVRVVNKHHEAITVVVSKYRPNRLLSGANINVSATGGGLGFNSTTYLGPATTKTLAANAIDSRASTAVFPLWTRADDFGVISIFKGTEKTLYIENDRVPAGSTAYFMNTPDLTLVPYGEELEVPIPDGASE